jgi:hypothetical protein
MLASVSHLLSKGVLMCSGSLSCFVTCLRHLVQWGELWGSRVGGGSALGGF